MTLLDANQTPKNKPFTSRLFEINCDSLCLTPEDTADTLRVLDLYACSRLDPMETIGTRGEDRYRHQKLVATATSGDVLVAAGDGM